MADPIACRIIAMRQIKQCRIGHVELDNGDRCWTMAEHAKSAFFMGRPSDRDKKLDSKENQEVNWHDEFARAYNRLVQRFHRILSADTSQVNVQQSQ